MPEFDSLLQNIDPFIGKTAFHDMSQVLFGILVTNGRITLFCLSRWTEKVGTFGRTIRRIYYSVLPWNRDRVNFGKNGGNYSA